MKLLKLTLRNKDTPYYINEEGLVGGQKHWQGTPAKLLGFNTAPIQTLTKRSLGFGAFWKQPFKAIGLYPIFRHDKNIILVYEMRVIEIEVCEGKRKNIIYKQ
jgi:hypothetical protein